MYPIDAIKVRPPSQKLPLRSPWSNNPPNPVMRRRPECKS